jgi:Co/Zn/Cd efflux system component
MEGSRKEFFSNINIQAAYIHIISDIILSIGVIISAIIIYFGADP